MAIRKEHKLFYGLTWRKYRALLLTQRGHTRCSHCDQDWPKYLNFCHRSHDPLSADLIWLCPRCHGKNDAQHSAAVRRRTLAKKDGQHWLTPEIQGAADPLPRRPPLDPAAQGEMFP